MKNNKEDDDALYRTGSLVRVDIDSQFYLREPTNDMNHFVRGGTLLTVVSVRHERGACDLVDLRVFTGEIFGWVYSRHVRLVSR